MEQHKVSTDRRNKEVVAYIYICVCVCVCVRVHMCVYIYICIYKLFLYVYEITFEFRSVVHTCPVFPAPLNVEIVFSSSHILSPLS